MAQPVAQPKFKVLKALGKGSYGTVYKVQRLADDGVYAMKETDMGRMGPKERADAVNEIRVLGSINHPNVVRHHETFLSGNKLCIVMEYAPAGDLASFIRAASASKLPLPECTIWQVLLQLCQGMQAIHETCVIHRDLKPANIFMCPDNVVKVGDLGVAKALTKAHYAQTTIGTPVFMAPEVWRGLRYGYSSDLWSLGGILYEMMTYRLPFDGRSLNELKNRIIMGSFQPLMAGAPYSAALVTVCHALLNKDPRKRPTCAAILNSSEAAPWLHMIPEPVRLPLPALDAVPSIAPLPAAAPSAGPNPQLLPTIHVPRDIRLLPQRLPKPQYDDVGGGLAAARQPQVTPQAMAAPAPAAAAAAPRMPMHSPRQAGPSAAAHAAVLAAQGAARAAGAGGAALGAPGPSAGLTPGAAAAPAARVPSAGLRRPPGIAVPVAPAAAAGGVPRTPPGAAGGVPRTPPGAFGGGAGAMQRVPSAMQRVPSANAAVNRAAAVLLAAKNSPPGIPASGAVQQPLRVPSARAKAAAAAMLGGGNMAALVAGPSPAGAALGGNRFAAGPPAAAAQLRPAGQPRRGFY